MTASCTLLCCSMFHIGSRPMLISGLCLRRIKACNNWNCKWSQRFLKSCPLISLKVGRFHLLDRGRGPAFIRFILQRTLLLILKTRLSVDSGGKMFISVPLCTNEFLSQ